jgi:hypothetical protein
MTGIFFVIVQPIGIVRLGHAITSAHSSVPLSILET